MQLAQLLQEDSPWPVRFYVVSTFVFQQLSECSSFASWNHRVVVNKSQDLPVSICGVLQRGWWHSSLAYRDPEDPCKKTCICCLELQTW